jgi:hypothetical protein
MNVLAAVLQILGLVALVVAGFLVGPALGALAAGLGLLVVGLALESEG